MNRFSDPNVDTDAANENLGFIWEPVSPYREGPYLIIDTVPYLRSNFMDGRMRKLHTIFSSLY